MARKTFKTARLDVRITPKLKKKFDASIKNINKHLKDEDQTDKSFWICYFIDMFTSFEDEVRNNRMVKEMKKNNFKLPAEGFFLYLNQAYVKHVGKTGVKGMPDLNKLMACKKAKKK